MNLDGSNAKHMLDNICLSEEINLSVTTITDYTIPLLVATKYPLEHYNSDKVNINYIHQFINPKSTEYTKIKTLEKYLSLHIVRQLSTIWKSNWHEE